MEEPMIRDLLESAPPDTLTELQHQLVRAQWPGLLVLDASGCYSEVTTTVVSSLLCGEGYAADHPKGLSKTNKGMVRFARYICQNGQRSFFGEDGTLALAELASGETDDIWTMYTNRPATVHFSDKSSTSSTPLVIFRSGLVNDAHIKTSWEKSSYWVKKLEA